MSDETMSMLDDRIAELEDENAALQRENAVLRADLLTEEERSIYWRDNENKAMAENAALRALLSEPYGFFTFGHKALSPWGKALDNWCERAKPLLEKKEAQP